MTAAELAKIIAGHWAVDERGNWNGVSAPLHLARQILRAMKK